MDYKELTRLSTATAFPLRLSHNYKAARVGGVEAVEKPHSLRRFGRIGKTA